MVSDNVYVSNTTNLAKYMKLEQKGKVLAEYIWIDGSNGLRNKTKVSITTLLLRSREMSVVEMRRHSGTGVPTAVISERGAMAAFSRRARSHISCFPPCGRSIPRLLV